MKKAISLLLALVMCLSLCACGENTPTDGSTTPNSTHAQTLADFDILGKWIIADDGLAVITFNEDGTCVREGEAAVKYKVEADIAVLTIYYSTPQSYNIEKVGDHYRITGEHFLLREVEEAAIEEIAAKQAKYERAFALLEPYLDYTDRPWQAIATLGNENIVTAYFLLQEIQSYRDTANHLQYFAVVENVLLKDPQYYYGYNNNGQQTWRGIDHFVGYRYYYDDNGLLVRTVRDDSVGYYETTFQYDNKGQQIERKTDYHNTLTGEILPYFLGCYVYDDQGFMIQEDKHWYKFGGYKESKSSLKYTYDEHGQLIREEGVSESEEVDDSGNSFMAQSTVLNTWENKYNEHGQLVERKQTEGSPYYNIWKYAYDENGNVTEEETYTLRENGHALWREYLYSYNDRGDAVWSLLITYERDGVTEKGRSENEYKYTYGTFYWYDAPEA